MQLYQQIYSCLEILAPNLDCCLLAQAYFSARLIMFYTSDGDYASTIQNSWELKKIMHIYRNAVSPNYTAENTEHWVRLCQSLHDSGLILNYRRFFAQFAPNIVQDWQAYKLQITKCTEGNLLAVLCMLLQIPCDGSGEIPVSELEKYHTRDCHIYNKIGIDYDQYCRCWYAINYTHLPDITPKPLGAIREAKQLYLKNYLPLSDLLSDYAALHLGGGTLQQKRALRGRRRKKELAIASESGRSKEDLAIERALHDLALEKPSDVIRELFYCASRNDSALECSYIMREIVSQIHEKSRILIVNPSPDYLINLCRYSLLCSSICVITPDSIVAALYRSEFEAIEFIGQNEIDKISGRSFNLCLGLSRDTMIATLEESLAYASKDAKLCYLIPEVSITRAESSFLRALQENGFGVDRIVSLTRGAIHSFPKKKAIVWADASEKASFLLSYSRLSDCKDAIHICKNTYQIPLKWLDGSLTFADIRKKFKLPQRRNINIPMNHTSTFGPQRYN